MLLPVDCMRKTPPWTSSFALLCRDRAHYNHLQAPIMYYDRQNARSSKHGPSQLGTPQTISYTTLHPETRVGTRVPTLKPFSAKGFPPFQALLRVRLLHGPFEVPSTALAKVLSTWGSRLTWIAKKGTCGTHNQGNGESKVFFKLHLHPLSRETGHQTAPLGLGGNWPRFSDGRVGGHTPS